MPDGPKPQPGDIGWVDLTIPDAGTLRDFYARVVGWTPAPVDMKGYQDFNMNHPETGQPIAGICHQRGPNADLPATWLIYIVVADLNTALDQVSALGGKILRPPKSGFAIIQDPAGATCALYQPPTSDF